MRFSKEQVYSNLVIAIFIIVIPLVNFSHHKYSGKEGVIEWDVKSYYAYLPAAFIYKDLSFDFINDKDKDLENWIWPVTTPTGKKAILTTMGLSVLYAPFFLVGHVAAIILPQYEATGYSFPYHVALQFSTFIYFLISLIVLRKILKRYFDDDVIALTLFAIGAGTNLFYYITYSAPMAHGYNFFLIVLFIFYLERWSDSFSIKDAILLGVISGLVALIRPTNILVLMLIPFWRVGNWSDFQNRVQVLLKKWPYVLLMAFMFVLVWSPQFAYWKYVSGKFFYFSYGERGDTFYFANPQIWKVLFSYEKGWFVYTPMMLLAFLGFFSLRKKEIKLSVPILIYVALMIYVLSSWWCWWYGGSFGQRSMVDFYGLMAIPLAALFQTVLKKRFVKSAAILLVLGLIAFNQFNIQQLNKMALSYWWMNKEGYWENFLKLHPTCKYWDVAMHPDYEKARLGIYEWVAPFNRKQEVTNEMLVKRIVNDNKENKDLVYSLKAQNGPIEVPDSVLLTNFAEIIVDNKLAETYFKRLKIDYYLNEINICGSWKKDIEKKAKKRNLTYEQMALMEAERVYTNYSQRYDQR